MKYIVMTMAAVLLSTMAVFGQTKTNDKKEEKMGTIHLTTKEFKEKVYNYEVDKESLKYLGDKPAIVDFFATWCGPCKALSPVLDELAKEYAGKIYIYKVDVDKERELSGVFGIRSIPTLLYIPMDAQPSMASGAPTKEQLKKMIDEMVNEK